MTRGSNCVLKNLHEKSSVIVSVASDCHNYFKSSYTAMHRLAA